MKKILPVLLGFLLPLTLFLYLLGDKDKPINTNTNKFRVLGVNVGYGDPNVKEVSYPPLYTKKFDEIIEGKSGQFSIFVKNLNTGQTINVGMDNVFYSASLFKVPIAIYTLQLVENETIKLNQELTYEGNHFYTGSGTLKNEPIGSKYTVEVLLTRLIKDSDNVAQSILLDKTGQEGVYAIMPNPRSLKASQISLILEKLYLGEYLTLKNTKLLLNIMQKTSFDDRIHTGLVKGLSFSHKIGNWARTGSWHDCGILTRQSEPIIVCVMSKKTTYKDFMAVTENIGTLVSKTEIN